MAEIVAAVHGLRGSLYSSIAFARRLAARGHRVTFVGFREVGDEVREAGFEWVGLHDGPRSEALLRARRADVGTVRALPTARRLRTAMINSTEVADVLNRIEPDLLVVDSEMHGVILPAIARRLPMLLVVPWSSPFRAPGLPAMHTSRHPPENARERMMIEMEWERLFLGRAVRQTIGRLAPRAIRRRLLPFQLNSPSIADVRALARANGLTLRQVSTTRQWCSPVMYPSLPHLSMTAAAFDFPHDAPPQLHYAGPMIDVDRAEPLVSFEDRRRWEEFRDRAAREGRRIVYASMGSLQPGTAAFYSGMVDLVRDRDDLATVMGLGQRKDRAGLGELPANALALDYAPQLEVLAASWVAVHHGGIGTINECVHFEVPSVAASTGFVDEPGAVARLAHHRLGIETTIHDVIGPDLRGMVERAGTDQTIRSGLRAMRTAFDEASADANGERLVETILASGLSSPVVRPAE